MGTIPLLKEQTEQRIQEALSSLLDEIAIGIKPQEALYKIAKSYNLSADQIRMLGRAYNTGIVLSRLKEKDLDKKASVPKLLDPEQVVREIFDNAAKHVKVSEDYSKPPKIKFAPPNIMEQLQKDAQFRKLARSIEHSLAVEELKNSEDYRKQRYQEALQKKADCLYRFEQILKQLSDYFVYSSSPIHPEEIIKNASLFYGNKVKELLDLIVKDLPTNIRYIQYQPVSWHVPPYSLVKQAHQILEEYKTAQTLLKQFSPSPRKSQSVSITKFSGSVIDAMCKQSCLYDALIRKNIVKKGGLDLGKITETTEMISTILPGFKGVSTFRSTSFQHRINQARVAVILADLMLNDDEISRYPREIVLKAYNELARLAPMAMQMPVIIRRALARYLAGGMDEFLINELLAAQQRIATDVNRTLSRWETAS